MRLRTDLVSCIVRFTKFRRAYKFPDETVDAYHIRLRRLAVNCLLRTHFRKCQGITIVQNIRSLYITSILSQIGSRNLKRVLNRILNAIIVVETSMRIKLTVQRSHKLNHSASVCRFLTKQNNDHKQVRVRM